MLGGWLCSGVVSIWASFLSSRSPSPRSGGGACPKLHQWLCNPRSADKSGHSGLARFRVRSECDIIMLGRNRPFISYWFPGSPGIAMLPVGFQYGSCPVRHFNGCTVTVRAQAEVCDQALAAIQLSGFRIHVAFRSHRDVFRRRGSGMVDRVHHASGFSTSGSAALPALLSCKHFLYRRVYVLLVVCVALRFAGSML